MHLSGGTAKGLRPAAAVAVPAVPAVLVVAALQPEPGSRAEIRGTLPMER